MSINPIVSQDHYSNRKLRITLDHAPPGLFDSTKNGLGRSEASYLKRAHQREGDNKWRTRLQIRSAYRDTGILAGF